MLSHLCWGGTHGGEVWSAGNRKGGSKKGPSTWAREREEEGNRRGSVTKTHGKTPRAKKQVITHDSMSMEM